MGDGIDQHLAGYLGDTTLADALRELARRLGGTFRLLPQLRLGPHWTGARLILVAFTESATDRPLTCKYLIKVLPAVPADREPGRHHQALRVDRSPAREFVRDHLVRQPIPAVPLADGRQLMFQEVANGGDRTWILDELDGADLLDTVRTVLTAILRRWNGVDRARRTAGLPIAWTTIGDYVLRELEAAGARQEVEMAAVLLGLADLHTDTLVLDRRIMSNPLRLLDAGSPFHDPFQQQVSYVAGFAHGDLHGGNVLGPKDADGAPRPGLFTLVDLSAFEKDAPLTRDPVCLLLAIALRYLPGLGPAAQEALIRYLIHPDGQPPAALRGTTVAAVVHLVDEVGAGYSKPEWTPEWRMQYWLSLISQTLICTTYENLGPDRRRWCFRVAALVLAAVEKDRPPAGPDHLPPGRPDQLDPGPAGFPGDLGGPPGWAAPTPLPGAQRGVGLVERPPPGRHRAPDDLPSAPGSTPLPPPADPQVRPGPPRQGGAATPAGSQRSATRRPVDAGPAPDPAPRVPRPRQPMDRAAPPTTGTTSPSDRPTLRRASCLAVLVVLAVAVVAVVQAGPGRTRRDDPNGTPSDGSASAPTWGPPSTNGDDHDELPAAAPELSALAQRMDGLDRQPGRGWYEYLCTRVWSTETPDGTVREDLYHDEQLWLNRRDGTVRRRVTKVDGTTRRPPDDFQYPKDGFAARNPVPADDPDDLREQIRRPAGGSNGTGDKPGRADVPTESSRILTEVARMYHYHLPDLDQQRALIGQLVDTPGLIYREVQVAWASSRPGLAVSADDGTGLRKTLIFDLQDGRLLSYQTIRLGGATGIDRTVGYESYLVATRTDRTDQQSCDDGRQQ